MPQFTDSISMAFPGVPEIICRRPQHGGMVRGTVLDCP